MQEHPDAFVQNMGRFINPNCYGDKKKLIQQHRKAYKESEEHRHHSYHVSIPNPFISKKGFDSSTCGDRKAALPIPVSKLQVDTVHHGRVLCGTLIEKPYVIQGVHCLLQDKYGGVVKVCFYPHELEQGSNSFNNKWKIGQQMFPEGTKIEIFEPYFKASMDGTYLVRVDNMADVDKDKSCLEPTTPMSLNEEGKRHVVALQYDEAIMSYKEAIKHINKAFPLYQVLLQNLSLVHIHLNHYNTALQCAVGAILMNSESAPKGYFRAAIALDELKCPLLAIHFCRLTLEQNRSATKDPTFRTLYKKLESSHSTPASSMTLKDLLKDDNMIELLSSNPISPLKLVEQGDLNDPNEIKQLGNEVIGKGDYLKAREFYEIALHKLESMQSIKMSTLFSNLSLCYFKSGQHHNAIINASTSMTIQPTNKKAHYRRIEGLLNLEMTEIAKVCFDYGKKTLVTHSDCLNPLLPRLVSNMKKSHENKPKTTGERYKPQYASYQSVEQMNALIEMSGKGQGYFRDIPSFHIKYSRAKQWPNQSAPEKCQALLDEAHALGRSGMHRFVLEKMPKSILNEAYFMKRLGSSDKNHLNWLLTSNQGDVSFRKRFQYDVAGNIHHSFGNVAQQPQIMTGGTTHVSVGFADLQEISICKINDPDNCENKPLRWVGYDSSPYVVAKTLVLIEMLQDKVTPVESIAQVWFSAAWSNETLKAFRKALAIIMSTKGFHLLPHFVQEFLIYWQHHDVSLKSSIDKWMESHTCPWSDEICNWKREQDYLSICTYAMTGQLHYDNLTVGSVVMFALPGGGKVADNEDIFQVVNLKELLEHYDQHGILNGDCVQALTTLLEGRIHRLKSRIQSQKITLEVHCEKVNLKNEILIDKICNDLRPYTMSWSNVCDYVDTAQFHNLAQKCSVGNETIHFGYSMNWPCDVKGAFIGDFCLGEENDELKDFIKMSLSTFEDVIERIWKEKFSNAIKYLTFPTHTHPMNVVDWGLTNRLYEAWFQAFIHAGGEMMEHQFSREMIGFYQFNQRTNSVLFFHWTYDSDTNLVPKDL